MISSGTPARFAKASDRSRVPASISGAVAYCIEWMSSRKSAESTMGRSARARVSSTDWRAPSRVGAEHSRLKCSSTRGGRYPAIEAVIGGDVVECQGQLSPSWRQLGAKQAIERISPADLVAVG